jgi:dynein heavy chain
MNGLKMVWIISRNYKNSEKMQELISLITDEIADKVQNNIQISKLFSLTDKAEGELQTAKELIVQGKAILESWDAEFQRTQTSMDDEQLERWEFQPAPLV